MATSRANLIEVPPLDEAFRRLMPDPRINVHLVPLPKGTKRLLGNGKHHSDPEHVEKPDKKKTKMKKAPQLPPSLKGTERPRTSRASRCVGTSN